MAAGAEHEMNTTVNAVAIVVAFALVPAMFGCTSKPVTVQVKVPVPVECRETIPDRPVMPAEALSPGAALWDLVRAALAEIDRREAYEVRMRTSLVVCTTPVE